MRDAARKVGGRSARLALLSGASYVAIGALRRRRGRSLPRHLAFAVLQHLAERCSRPRDAWARREVRR